MKKLTLTLLVCMATFVVNAQKVKPITGVISPNSDIVKILPDLTFDLIPVLSSGGNGYEAVAGIPGRIKIPLRFIVKNIGNATSKPCKVETEIFYAGARTRVEIEQGTPEGAFNRTVRSEPMQLQAIEKNKDVLRNHAFIFSNFPEEAWGKRVKIITRIIYPTYNGEISSTNNVSNAYEFDLIK